MYTVHQLWLVFMQVLYLGQTGIFRDFGFLRREENRTTWTLRARQDPRMALGINGEYFHHFVVPAFL